MPSPEYWEILSGTFDRRPDGLTFKGGVVQNPLTNQATMFAGTAMSNLRFTGGTISARVRYTGAEVAPAVQIVLSRDVQQGSLLTAGLASSGPGAFAQWGNFAVLVYDSASSESPWRTLAATAMVVRQPADEYHLTVKQQGSLLDVYSGNVHVLRHKLGFRTRVSQCGVFCWSPTDVDIEPYTVEARPSTAFVVMQFSPPFEDLFSEVVHPVCREYDVVAEKADDIAGPGLIIADIVRRLHEADIIIADITPENENVFYEIGYAHAIGKPTILLAERGRRLPFDLSGFRTLFYDNSIAGKSQIEEGLRRHITAILSERE